jgi:hypothetical protein
MTTKESWEATIEARCGWCKKPKAQEAMRTPPALRETTMKSLGVEEVASCRSLRKKPNEVSWTGSREAGRYLAHLTQRKEKQEGPKWDAGVHLSQSSVPEIPSKAGSRSQWESRNTSFFN